MTANDTPTQRLPTADDVSGMKTARTGGVVRAGVVMAVATLVSRFTGFLSKVVLLSALGVGVVNDAYTLSNTLPNIVFELLIGGVLTSVAIPLLSRARSDPDGGELYTQRLMTAAVVGLLVATVLAVLAAPLLTRLYLSDDSLVDHDLANSLAYLLLPQIFFYGIAALFGAILNTKEKFGVPAWAPVANNLVVIVIGIAFFLMSVPASGDRAALTDLTRGEVLFLGIGTTAGIVLQALVMVPTLLRTGFRFRWRWGGDRRLLEAGQLMLWAVVYVLISQAGYIVVTKIASGNVEGGITTYAFASMLFQLPYGIIGVSILTAIMPRMSRHAAAGQYAEMKNDASLANRLSIVALTPLAAGIMVLASSLAIVVALYGAVSLDDTIVLGTTLAALALGLVPFAVTLVQMRVFYAMKDARTPALINGIMVLVRIPLLLICASLDPSLIIPGLAVATSISYLVGAIAGEIWLRVRYGPMGTRRTLVTLLKMTVAGAAGGGAALLAGHQLLTFEVDTLGEALLEILFSGTIGLLVIAAVATALRVDELVPLRNRVVGLTRRIFRRSQPNASASPHVQDTGRGTLESAASRPDVAGQPPAADRTAARPPAEADRTVTISREQVSRAVANDPEDPGATTVMPAEVTPADETLPATTSKGLVKASSTDLAPALAPGTTVGGRYRLVSLVSADHSGHWFWRAKDTVLPRDMAVTMLPDTSGASATVARTLRAGRLHHIGLPQTLDVGTDHGQSYVVGQWVDGATLTDLLSGGPLDPEVATSITAKLSEAVAEAHRNGIALGAINPSLIRVNFDGQVRLSHVIAHASATPDQDIRSIGALLYLMLTGTWPLGEPVKPGSVVIDPTALGPDLPPAPTRLGRELPANEVRSTVPEALSALAERALHPEEPDGIHAVGAIAALLRSPETIAGMAQPTPPAQARPLSPADRRLIKERRVKLGLASVVLAVFAVLIVIAIGGLTNQFVASIQNSAPEELPMIDSGVATSEVVPTPTPDAGTPTEGAATSAAGPPAAAPVAIVGGTVFDPQGDGSPDYKDYVDRAFDGNQESAWLTWVYKQQLPSLKTGVGLSLELEKEVTPASVTVSSATNNTTVEIRSSTTPNPTSLDQTTVVGTGTVTNATAATPGSTTIALTGAPKSKYLIVFVTKMSPTNDGQFQSKINEITVTGT